MDFENKIEELVDNMCRPLHQGIDIKFTQAFENALPEVFQEKLEMLRFMNYVERQDLFQTIVNKFMEKREGIFNAYNE